MGRGSNNVLYSTKPRKQSGLVVEHPRFRPSTHNLGLSYYYENHEGYSGTSGWLVRSLALPKSWKSKASEEKESSSWRQEMLLGSAEGGFNGNSGSSCYLGVPYRKQGAWLAPLKDTPYQVNLDHLTAIKTLTHPGGSYRLQMHSNFSPAVLTYHDTDGSLLGALALGIGSTDQTFD